MSTNNSVRPVTRTGWTGWAQFGGVILFVSGIFSVIQALIVLIGPNAYYAVVDGELFLFSTTGWGWWNLMIGVLLVLTAVSLLAGATWARILAVVFAVISAIIQMLLIPAQPWWSIIVIALDVLVIYALIAHGDELALQD